MTIEHDKHECADLVSKLKAEMATKLSDRESRIRKLNLEIDLKNEHVQELFELFERTGADVTGKDRLAVLVHYFTVKNSIVNRDGLQPNELKDDRFFNKLYYDTIRAGNETLPLDGRVLVCVLKSGKYCDIELKYKNFASNFLKVNLDELESLKQREKFVKLFERDFTDRCLIPLKHELVREKPDLKQRLGANFLVSLWDLPNELLVYKLILKYLNIKSIVALGLTCKHFYELVNDSRSPVWERLVRRDFPNVTHPDINDFKTRYRRMYLIKLVNFP